MDTARVADQAMPMLHCEPRSMFSWTFDVSGAPEGPAEVIFNVLTEQGAITLGRDRYEVIKLGPGSGRWQLTRDQDVIAQAYKPSAFRRLFELSGANGELILRASSAFRRSFEILRDNRLVGRIEPTSAFRRRATVDGDASLSTTDQLFAFWLAVQMWRRAAKSND